MGINFFKLFSFNPLCGPISDRTGLRLPLYTGSGTGASFSDPPRAVRICTNMRICIRAFAYANMREGVCAYGYSSCILL